MGERANGAKPGEHTYMAAFQGGVSAFIDTLDKKQILDLERKRADWMKLSYPIDVQRKKSERGHLYLKESAESLFKETGMRLAIWEFHENKDGRRLFQL